MHSFVNCFTHFKSSIANVILPERFTFPFYYQPHPLSILAVEELQSYLEHQTAWQHDFGFAENAHSASGKMFGVLVVQNLAGEIGYLSAFSGKLADQSIVGNFVPPVFDTYAKDGFFLTAQREINQINDQIDTLQSNVEIETLSILLKELIKETELTIANYREVIIQGRKHRKAKREAAKAVTDENSLAQLNELLSKESIKEKNHLRDLKLFWQNKRLVVEQKLTRLTDEIEKLKQQRKKQSNSLQQKLFNHYRFLNSEGEEKNLNTIFDEIPDRTPPAGSGDCAAPKLLQYAFQHNLTPITLAEFWWGAAPKSEIRQHKNFYGSCQGKCQPILGHMLAGIELDDNPLLINPAIGKTLEILYQDEHMLVINKPSEFLSVPGKSITDSVYTRIKTQFPEATGPIIVHRLDMSTSGLMVIALTKRAHKKLQQQFISRVVKKRYVALIDGNLLADSGTINLPLRVDLNDRPRQVVCYDYGKAAETKWQVVGKNEGIEGQQTRVHLFPKTGRTHQLRMHCAHVDGLNMPIVGDDLYGKKAKRLHLHAAYLAFLHPISKAEMEFDSKEDF